MGFFFDVMFVHFLGYNSNDSDNSDNESDDSGDSDKFGDSDDFIDKKQNKLCTYFEFMNKMQWLWPMCDYAGGRGSFFMDE